MAAFLKRCCPGEANNCVITPSYRTFTGTQTQWRDALLQICSPLHVFVQSLAISNIIPHFVLSKYSSFSVCFLNPSISASEANLIFYFPLTHPSLLMVFFCCTSHSLHCLTLELFFGFIPLKLYFSDSPSTLSVLSILPDGKMNKQHLEKKTRELTSLDWARSM